MKKYIYRGIVRTVKTEAQEEALKAKGAVEFKPEKPKKANPKKEEE